MVHTDICSHDFFDLLELPIEVRLMIYRFVFGTERDRITVRGGAKNNPELYAKQNRVAVPGLELLCVNKQVNAEATMVMKEMKACVIDFSLASGTVRAQPKLALQFFRRFKLYVPAFGQNWDWHQENALYCFLKRLRENLTKGHKKSDSDARFSIDIVWLDTLRRQLKYLDPAHVQSLVAANGIKHQYISIWYKVQLQFMADKFCEELRKVLPNLDLTSNAHIRDRSILYRRVNSSEIRFADTGNQQLGRVIVIGSTSAMEISFDKYEEPEKYVAT